METAATKALIVKVLQEAFDECVQTWNLEELEEKNLADALFGPETIERIFNVTQISSLYSDEGKILIQGELKSVSAPTDSSKPIKLAVEVMNTHDRRMKLADIGYSVIDIFALPEGEKKAPEGIAAEADEDQTDIEDYLDGDEGEFDV